MKHSALLVAGIIFALVALIHIVRLFHHFPVIIGDFSVPIWGSIIAAAITAILSIWMFAALKE